VAARGRRRCVAERRRTFAFPLLLQWTRSRRVRFVMEPRSKIRNGPHVYDNLASSQLLPEKLIRGAVFRVCRTATASRSRLPSMLTDVIGSPHAAWARSGACRLWLDWFAVCLAQPGGGHAKSGFARQLAGLVRIRGRK
jgi:hypothetical protein